MIVGSVYTNIINIESIFISRTSPNITYMTGLAVTIRHNKDVVTEVRFEKEAFKELMGIIELKAMDLVEEPIVRRGLAGQVLGDPPSGEAVWGTPADPDGCREGGNKTTIPIPHYPNYEATVTTNYASKVTCHNEVIEEKGVKVATGFQKIEIEYHPNYDQTKLKEFLEDFLKSL